MIDDLKCILLINGIPYYFPSKWVESESLDLSSGVALSNTGEAPIITPAQSTLSVTFNIPLGNSAHRAYFKIAKEAIRTAQFMFTNSTSQGLMIPFSSIKMPWQFLVSCAYCGVSNSLACCTLDSFSVSATGGSTIEQWSLSFTELRIDRTNDLAGDNSKIGQTVASDQFGGLI